MYPSTATTAPDVPHVFEIPLSVSVCLVCPSLSVLSVRLCLSQEKVTGQSTIDQQTSSRRINLGLHFGRRGVKAENLLNDLAQKSKNLEGRKNSKFFGDAVSLQRYNNSMVILNKLSRISSSSEEPETLFDRDIQSLSTR